MARRLVAAEPRIVSALHSYDYPARRLPHVYAIGGVFVVECKIAAGLDTIVETARTSARATRLC